MNSSSKVLLVLLLIHIIALAAAVPRHSMAAVPLPRSQGHANETTAVGEGGGESAGGRIQPDKFYCHKKNKRCPTGYCCYCTGSGGALSYCSDCC